MSDSDAAVIAVEGLTRRFGHFTAVDRLSFTVERGELFGFLGPNGAGKSTTIRMLCGLLRSTAGTARVGGCDINREAEGVRQRIGYMSQRFSLYRDLTVRENVAFFGGAYGLEGERLRQRFAEVIALTGLEGMEELLAGHLSGAHQQRLALGCAILHDPPILFLDEPTSGVDPISRRRFWDLIHDMTARGVTVLVTTHFMDEAEFCGRIGFIDAGHLIALDTPTRLKRNAVAGDLFEIAALLLRPAAAALSGMEGVASVSYFGAKLHALCRPDRYDAPSLRLALERQGVQAASVERVAPTLEDAFLRLTLHEAAGAPPRGGGAAA